MPMYKGFDPFLYGSAGSPVSLDGSHLNLGELWQPHGSGTITCQGAGAIWPAASNPRMIWKKGNSDFFATDAYVEVTLAAFPAFTTAGPMLRHNGLTAGSENYYQIGCYSSGTNCQRVIGGVGAGIAADLGTGWAAGDRCRVEISGTGATVTITIKKNDVTIGTYNDTHASRIVASGYVGISSQNTTAVRIAPFRCGPLTPRTVTAASSPLPRFYALESSFGGTTAARGHIAESIITSGIASWITTQGEATLAKGYDAILFWCPWGWNDSEGLAMGKTEDGSTGEQLNWGPRGLDVFNGAARTARTAGLDADVCSAMSRGWIAACNSLAAQGMDVCLYGCIPPTGSEESTAWPTSDDWYEFCFQELLQVDRLLLGLDTVAALADTSTEAAACFTWLRAQGFKMLGEPHMHKRLDNNPASSLITAHDWLHTTAATALHAITSTDDTNPSNTRVPLVDMESFKWYQPSETPGSDYAFLDGTLAAPVRLARMAHHLAGGRWGVIGYVGDLTTSQDSQLLALVGGGRTHRRNYRGRRDAETR